MSASSRGGCAMLVLLLAAAAACGRAPPPEPVVPVTAAPEALAALAVARDALGAPYRYGGQSRDGFDCSGLIQLAYARQGIRLPRTAAEQAKAGEPVPRDLARLAPGDILTFSAAGERVTHVGLFLGGDRFIHSARGGVQESRLREDDPAGRWYWQRWVGARRVATAR